MDRRFHRYMARYLSFVVPLLAMGASLVGFSAFFLKDSELSSLMPIFVGVVASLVGGAMAYSAAIATKLARRGVPSVFISYSHKDAAFAEKLSEALKGMDVHPLLDRMELKVGDDIRTAVDNMIDKSDYFLFVISPNSAKSDWARKEVEQATKREKKILPVVLDVNAVPEQLSGVYYADFSEDFENGITQLRKSIRPTAN